MKSNYLFPIIFRKIGWGVFIPFLIWGVGYLISGGTFIEIAGSNTLALFDGLTDTNIFSIAKNDSWTDEIIVVFLTISMLFIGFSKEKDEDECIASIRMNALIWAIMVNSILLIICTLVIFGTPYLNFMTIYMFSLLFLFITRYFWTLYRFRRDAVI